MPALAVQDFFFGATPVSAGLDFLTGFANQIQTPAGGGFSVINTYVNMAATDAINPNSSFGATYGLSAISSEMTFFVDVYAKIFGTAPTQGAINNYFNVQTFNLPNGTTITGTTFDFYKEYVREFYLHPSKRPPISKMAHAARSSERCSIWLKIPRPINGPSQPTTTSPLRPPTPRPTATRRTGRDTGRNSWRISVLHQRTPVPPQRTWALQWMRRCH